MVCTKVQPTVAQDNDQQGQPLSDFLLAQDSHPPLAKLYESHAGPDLVVACACIVHVEFAQDVRTNWLEELSAVAHQPTRLAMHSP